MPQPSKAPPHHSFADVVVELGEHAHHAAESVHDYLEKGNNAFKFISGVKAFKAYSWIKGAPIKTVSALTGKKRVIVVSRGWRFIHDVTIENAEALDKFGDYVAAAGVVLELAKSRDKLREIHASSDSPSVKAQRYITWGSMTLLKTVSAPILPVTHLITQGLVKAATLANAPYGDLAINARAVDIAVQSSYGQLMDSDNFVGAVNSGDFFNYIRTHAVVKH